VRSIAANRFRRYRLLAAAELHAKKYSHWNTCLRLPREIESSHILVMVIQAKAKSALIRQILLQIEERGETAIVYDPATPADYVPYFLTSVARRFDSQSARPAMPYWTPGDELRQGAELSHWPRRLFPDRHNENSFFR